MKTFKGCLCALVLQAAAWSQVDTNSGHFYLFTYFINAQEDAGARLAVSSDGIDWQLVNNETPIFTPTLSPEHLMRDPMTFFDPSARTFHIVWTSGWNQTGIGYASSRDLKSWTPQTDLQVGAKIENCRCCWAPEIFFDDIRNKFMIFWSTDNGVGKRSYYVLTSDFKTFSDPVKFFDPGYTEIDACMLKVADGKYYMFFKDERNSQDAGRPAKNIHYVYGSTPQGPWSDVSGTITAIGCEGPSAIKIGGEYRVYFDPYSNFSSNDRMVSVTNPDTVSSPWPGGQKLYKFGAGGSKTGFSYSHGHIIEIPREFVMHLLYDRPLSSVKFNWPGLKERSNGFNQNAAASWIDVLGRNMGPFEASYARRCSVAPTGFFLVKNRDGQAKRQLFIVK
jgi:hypothetical protein